jgi:hypothetical protein
MPLTLRKMIAVLSLSWLSMAGHTAALSANEQQKLESVVVQLNQLPKTDNKYSQQAKDQALTIIAQAVKASPNLAAALTEFAIKQGTGVSATVKALAKVAPKQAGAIVTAAIKASKPSMAAAIAAAALSVAPKQAATITQAAIIASPKQAAAITSAAITTAPSQTKTILQTSLKMGNSSEERRKVAVAADNAGIKEIIINQILREITINNKGQYEVFKHNQQNTSDSIISIGSVNDSSSATGLTTQGQGVNISLNNQTTGSTGGGGGCQKTLTATCS